MLLWYNIKVVGTEATRLHDADIAQLVEHVIGNDEVISSNLIISSKNPTQSGWIFCFISNIQMRKVVKKQAIC